MTISPTTRIPYAPGPVASPAIRPAASPPGRATAEPAALSAAAPRGADPALWSILTAEERAFFTEGGALSSATYGAPSRPSASAGAAPLGQRLDVRA